MSGEALANRLAGLEPLARGIAERVGAERQPRVKWQGLRLTLHFTGTGLARADAAAQHAFARTAAAAAVPAASPEASVMLFGLVPTRRDLAKAAVEVVLEDRALEDGLDVVRTVTLVVPPAG